MAGRSRNKMVDWRGAGLIYVDYFWKPGVLVYRSHWRVVARGISFAKRCIVGGYEHSQGGLTAMELALSSGGNP